MGNVNDGHQIAALSSSMANLKYPVIMTRVGDGSWAGRFPDIPELTCGGFTLEEAKTNAQSGLQSWVDAAKAGGEPIPSPMIEVLEIEVATS